MASVTANRITIEYEEQGSGEPLLMLMGLGAQLIDWPQPFVDMVSANGFRVIRMDNRDAGFSTEFTAPALSMRQMATAALTGKKPPTEYTLSDMAADAAGLLDALGIESAHVVGFSMGGMIAQALAIEHPARVRTLASMSSNTGSRRAGRPKVAMLMKAARLPDPTLENAVEMGVSMWRLIAGPEFDEAEARAMGAAAIARSFRPTGPGRQTAAILAGPDRTKGLAKLRVPTLVVHGMVDPMVQPSGGLATAKAVPHSRLLMFNDMGHNLPRSRRQEIADAIAVNASRVAKSAG